MAATYDRLVLAGAPAIEEPLFFRVTPSPKRDALAVTLRRRSILRSEVLALRYVYLGGLPASDVDGAVVSAMISAHDEIQPHLAHLAAVTAVLGGNLRPTPVGPGEALGTEEEPEPVEATPRAPRARKTAEVGE
jgi:hypothetical protein